MKVRLLEHATVAPGVTSFLVARLPPPFQVQPPEIWDIPANLGFDAVRQQHNALRLLQALPPPASDEAVLAVVGLDLFLPVLTYVFGASALGHRQSLLSVSRLHAPDGDATILHRRALIEALHELGHGLGLLHCPLASCPMHQSFRPEAIDLKDSFYCPLCQDRLRALCPQL